MAQEALITDYFYGDESEQFSYFRVPRLLITSPRFKGLSTDAKLLYGMLLDRMSLSAKNGWYDEQSRVYIYYTADEIRTDMGCGNDKALKLLSELDTKKGVGLIERIKQGQGKPTKIYVKRFTTRELPADTAEPSAQCPDTGRGADIDFSDFQTSEKSMSRPRQSRCADLGKTDASYPSLSRSTRAGIMPNGTQRSTAARLCAVRSAPMWTPRFCGHAAFPTSSPVSAHKAMRLGPKANTLLSSQAAAAAMCA